ncbi:MAG: hypothetical protein K5912_01270 [Alphaproteobacteria bacterium]|nr:hypothetical protein [Alphaproteobacteria bacterium]
MTINKRFFATVFMPISALFACHTLAIAAQAEPGFLSKYGQIQNVQNYSTNPFWSKDSPYNNKVPKPVYAQSVDVKYSDCMLALNSLFASMCSTRNNCVGLELYEVRPTIMVNLASLPGHNYATACAGYIDSAYSDYVKKNGHAGIHADSSFPIAIEANPNAFAGNTSATVSGEMFVPKTPYQQGVAERAQELAELHAQTASTSDSPVLAQNYFPGVSGNKTFTERWEDNKAKYKNYGKTKENANTAFKPLKVQSQEEAMDEFAKSNINAFCVKFPEREECNQLRDNFAKVKSNAAKAIADARSLWSKFSTEFSPLESAIKNAIKELQDEVDSKSDISPDSAKAIEIKIAALTEAVKPLQDEKDRRDAAFAKAKESAEKLLKEARALYGCYQEADPSGQSSNYYNAIVKLTQRISNSDTPATDIANAETDLRTVHQVFVDFWESKHENHPCTDYREVSTAPAIDFTFRTR